MIISETLKRDFEMTLRIDEKKKDILEKNNSRVKKKKQKTREKIFMILSSLVTLYFVFSPIMATFILSKIIIAGLITIVNAALGNRQQYLDQEIAEIEKKITNLENDIRLINNIKNFLSYDFINKYLLNKNKSFVLDKKPQIKKGIFTKLPHFNDETISVEYTIYDSELQEKYAKRAEEILSQNAPHVLPSVIKSIPDEKLKYILYEEAIKKTAQNEEANNQREKSEPSIPNKNQLNKWLDEIITFFQTTGYSHSHFLNNPNAINNTIFRDYPKEFKDLFLNVCYEQATFYENRKKAM